MNVEALQQMVRVLRTVSPEQFSLNTWHTNCGSTACAVGWAARDTWFQGQGLYLDWKDARLVPVFARRAEFEAIQEFFDIEGSLALYLFSPSHYAMGVSPEDVILRIEKVILNHRRL